MRSTSSPYDNLGRLTGAADGAGLAITIGYDALGRKVSEGSNWYGTTQSAYDLAGRRTRLTWRDGFAVDYRYLVRSWPVGIFTRFVECSFATGSPRKWCQ